MRNPVNVTTDKSALGKGVFKPSRAAIAGEMKCRMRLGNSAEQQREPEPTASRH